MELGGQPFMFKVQVSDPCIQGVALQSASCFLIVVLSAERLPVALIPEQLLISPVRYDMVDNRCRGDSSFLQTHHAQRVELEEALSRFPPPGVISSGGGASAQRIRRPFLPVFFAISAFFAQIWAAWKSAGAFR